MECTQCLSSPSFKGGDKIYKVVKGEVYPCTITKYQPWQDNGWNYLITSSFKSELFPFNESEVGTKFFPTFAAAKKIAAAYVRDHETRRYLYGDTQWIFYTSHVGRVKDLTLCKVDTDTYAVCVNCGIWRLKKLSQSELAAIGDCLVEASADPVFTVCGNFQKGGLEEFFSSSPRIEAVKESIKIKCLPVGDDFETPLLYRCDEGDSWLFADASYWE